ncbi:MAG: hypothetical protein ACFNQH_01365 [Veillonella parvula]
MLQKVYWYDVAIRLRDFIKAYRRRDGKRLFDFLVDRDDLKVKVGIGNAGEYPAIYILFDSEESVHKQGTIVGARISLFVDLFIKGEATGDVDYDDVLYRQMYDAENELIAVLNEFNRYLHSNGFGSNLVVEAVLSDGDENAPVVSANRVQVTIEWYDKGGR